jgi:TetR/AcrR family transcriptional repressor of mexJK operon
MAVRRQKSRDEVKHQAILKSATQLFLKQGFSHTSMDEIAAKARVTKQTVYAHFKSKDALFEHLILALSKKHSPSDALLACTNQPIEKSLHAIGMAMLGMLTSKDGLAATRLVISELPNHPGLAKRYYKDATQCMVDLMAKFLQAQHQKKLLVIKNPASASACFFSMLKGRYYVQLLLNVLPAPDPREKEKHVKETVENFLKLYGK